MYNYRCGRGARERRARGERRGMKRQEATAHHIQERSIEANDNKRSITYEKKPAAREKGPLSLLDRRRGRARTHTRLPSRSDISVWWTVGQMVVLRQESVARESLRISLEVCFTGTLVCRGKYSTGPTQRAEVPSLCDRILVVYRVEVRD